MDYISYLKNDQPIAYKVFYNALTNQKIFHAYLLSGEIGTPLLNIAKFLAASILCKHANPFACLNCSTCKRVIDENYGDLIVIDGKKDYIKKDQIQNIETEFSKTSLEKNGIKVYIINLIENMQEDSVNALLKFLEEPSDDTYAIFTTESEFRILPTILSRTQIVHFNLLNKEKLINESIKIGTTVEDAQLLVNFYNDPETIKEESNNPDFILSKKLILTIFEKISNKEKLRYYIEDQIIGTINSKPSARFFFDLLIFFFKESNSYKIEKETIFTHFVKVFESIIKNCPNLTNNILYLMESRNEINYNVNTSLLLMHVLTKIFEV